MRNAFLALLMGSTALAAASDGLAQTPAPQPGATPSASAATAGSVNAGALRNQPVFNASGQEVGRIGSVVIGPDNQASMVMSGGTFGNRQVLVPANRLAYQNNRLVATGYSEEQLRAMPAYTAGAAGYRNAEDGFALNVTGYTATAQAGQPGQAGQAGGEAARITLQQAAPTIQVEQSQPQVSVQQAQPQVTVRQAQPEILVRQPQPTVTVDIPQPEIIVRMPRPEVNVAQAQPQVEVRQAQPQVQVVPQAAPQVQVTPAQPQVNVQQAQAQPQVNVQGAEGQPQVRYERGEPKVVVNQAQGQPQVRIEQQDAAGQPGQPAPAARPQQQAATTPPRPAEPATTAAVPTGQGVQVSRINELKLYNAQGNDLGDVERVVQGPDGKQQLIIGSGGFLGLGERLIAVPIERVSMRADRLVLQGMTEDQLRAMPAFDRNNRSFRDLEDNQQVQITAAR